MENIPSFKRVVGNIPEEEKEKILERKTESFSDQNFEELEGKEREKTPEELQIIDLVNEATNDVLREYGSEGVEIPAENIHIILENEWPSDERDAFHNSLKQAIVLKEMSAKTVFLKKLFHELLHFKSYRALQVTNGDEPQLKTYRLGLAVVPRDGDGKYLNTINEAVTEELTKKFVTKLFKHPFFEKERQQTEEIINKYPDKVTRPGQPFFNEDTYYAEEYVTNARKDPVAGQSVAAEGSQTITSERFSYANERETLNILIDRLFEKNPDTFSDREEIFRLFAEGMMSGNLLTIGKLTDKTFGSGTFRKIGELPSDPEIQREFIESLG